MAEMTDGDQDGLLGQIKHKLARQEYDQAQLACARLLAAFPGCFEAHLIMSKLLLRSGQIRSATRYALSACDRVTATTRMPERIDLCSLLISLGEQASAYRLLMDCSRDCGPDENHLFDIALLFNALGREHEALSVLRQAERPWTETPRINQLIGTILGNAGSREIAADHLEKVVEHQPLNGQVQWTLSFLNLESGNERRIARMQAAISASGIDKTQQQLFCYALFREYDRLGDTEIAWRYLNEASSLRRSEVRHSSELETRCFDALIDSTPDLQFPAGAGESDITPVFILGMPRTGTSLLEKMLSGHPLVQPCGELAEFRAQLLWQIDRPMQGPLDDCLAKRMASIDFGQLGARYLERIRWRSHGARFLIDKEPFNYNYAGLIARALPNAKIIHVMRNPMDTCFSNLKEGFAPTQCTYSYTQEELATHYSNYRRLMSHWHSIAPGRILDVRYENLVTRPGQESERIHKFCGLPESVDIEAMQDRQYVSSTLSSIQLREPVHGRNVNAWKRYESHLQVLIERLAGEQEAYFARLDWTQPQ